MIRALQKGLRIH